MGAADSVIVGLAEYEAQRFGKTVEAYLETIEKHLSDAGLAGWVACRCAGELLEAGQLLRGSRVRERMNRVTEILMEFYGVEDARTSAVSYSGRSQVGPPTAVRIKSGAEPMPLHRIMADVVKGKGGPWGDGWAWIGDVTLNAMIVKPLVEACRDNLWDLLRFVGRRPVVGVWPRAGLSQEDLRRIWGICGDTDDEDVLGGAAAVLWTSDLAYIGEPGLLGKVVAAAPSGPLAWALFNPMGGHVPRDGKLRQESQAVAKAVAERVVRDPDAYSFRLVNGAANFLAETEGGIGAALFEECREILVDE